MNRKIATALFVAAAAVAGHAVADDITIDTTPFESSRTRAEVQDELARFKQAGVNPWSTSYNPVRGFQGNLSRAQVRGGFLADRDEVAARHAEDGGAASLARRAQPARTVVAGQATAAQ